MFGRIWARRHLFQIRNDAPFTTGFSESDLFAQSDLQAAAFGWLIQLGQFAQLAKSYPERVRVLNSDTLVHDAASALEKSTAWFGLGLDAELIEQVISGDAFSRDSKEPGRRFDQPKGDEAPVDQAEIDMVVEWTHAVASHVELPLNFGPRLMDA
jgi:hypothetical protein